MFRVLLVSCHLLLEISYSASKCLLENKFETYDFQKRFTLLGKCQQKKGTNNMTLIRHFQPKGSVDSGPKTAFASSAFNLKDQPPYPHHIPPQYPRQNPNWLIRRKSHIIELRVGYWENRGQQAHSQVTNSCSISHEFNQKHDEQRL